MLLTISVPFLYLFFIEWVLRFLLRMLLLLHIDQLVVNLFKVQILVLRIKNEWSRSWLTVIWTVRHLFQTFNCFSLYLVHLRNKRGASRSALNRCSFENVAAIGRHAVIIFVGLSCHNVSLFNTLLVRICFNSKFIQVSVFLEQRTSLFDWVKRWSLRLLSRSAIIRLRHEWRLLILANLCSVSELILVLCLSSVLIVDIVKVHHNSLFTLLIWLLLVEIHRRTELWHDVGSV